jgi:diguanylate cyclase (GGDEF)-like protein
MVNSQNPPAENKASYLFQILVLAALYFGFGHASFLTAVSHSIVTPVFFVPEGISLAAAILLGPRVWPGIFLGQFALAVSRGLSIEPALAISAINSVEAIIGCMLFRHLKLSPSLNRMRDLRWLLLIIFFVLQPFSATFGTATLLLSGTISGTQEYMRAWLSWWIGNSLGQSQITPLLLIAFAVPEHVKAALKDALLPLLLLIPAIWLTFGDLAPEGISAALVIFVPLLIWIAEVSGLMCVCIASSIIAASALFLTGHGIGPFVEAGKPNVFDMNVFIIGLSLTAQFVSTQSNERKYLQRELENKAHVDYLTGVSNRRHFMEKANLDLVRAVRYGSALSILMLDVDFFKKINDSHGHKTGDAVLLKLAEICRQTLREVDIIGRIGGEEFAILLPETQQKEAVEVAERLRVAIALAKVPLESGGLPLQFTVSIGVTSLAAKEDNLDVLLNRADKALYAAKEAGRNKVSVAVE